MPSAWEILPVNIGHSKSQRFPLQLLDRSKLRQGPVTDVVPSGGSFYGIEIGFEAVGKSLEAISNGKESHE